MHLKRSRPAADPAARSLLNAEGRAKLAALFEAHNCSRANMDLLVSGMSGGGLREEQLAKELRVMGLKWGQLTAGQVWKCGGGGLREEQLANELWDRC